MSDRYLSRLSNENLIKTLQSAMKTQPLLKTNRYEGLENIRVLQEELIKRFEILEPEAV